MLFLDEMPEFSRHALEVLRQPLEEGIVRIARAARTAAFPAAFMLVGAMNPCPCGYAGTDVGRAAARRSRSIATRRAFRGRCATGSILRCRWRRCRRATSQGDAGGEASSPIRERVVAARRRQLQRDGMLNARLEGRRLRGRVRLDGASRTLLEHAVSRLTLSARAFDRVLRVGRTIADLAESEVVLVEHLAEALQFRGSR